MLRLHRPARKHRFASLLWVLLWFSPHAGALAFGDSLTVLLALRTIGQVGNYQNAIDSRGVPVPDAAGGALILDLGAAFSPTVNDELWARARWAYGNGLNGLNATVQQPYGGELQADLQDINGTGRSYLLEAWYRHRFSFRRRLALYATLGIVDISRYIDENAFANDADAQFMNEVFTNVFKEILPNYEPGLVLNLAAGRWSLRAVNVYSGLNSPESFAYGALQLGFHPETRWGPGNYRVFGIIKETRTANAATNAENGSRPGLGISIDQRIGRRVGVFARGALQANLGNESYDRLGTVGVEFNGSAWGRPGDRIGMAYGYQEGADTAAIRLTHTAETYVRFRVDGHLSLTLDLQFMLDDYRRRPDVRAMIPGLRMNARF